MTRELLRDTLGPMGDDRLLVSWFLRLRWYGLAWGAAVLLAAVWPLGLTIPSLKIGALLLFSASFNFVARSAFADRFTERKVVGALLIVDTLIVAAVLNYAGGAMNPFSITFLLLVVLAAVLLGARWTWFIAGFTALCFAALFYAPQSVPEWEMHGAHHGFSAHLHGMFLAYCSAACFVAYLLNRLIAELRALERRSQRLEQVERSQRSLMALTSQAAGAAHELGTPLATINLVTHELMRRLERTSASPELLEDLRLLESEVGRCKSILRGLSERAGDLCGEMPAAVSLRTIVQNAIDELQLEAADAVTVSGDDVVIEVPRRALTLALRNIIKNGVDASNEGTASVQVKIASDAREVTVDVTDEGCGMSATELERVGEPFYSTKDEGHGMGLGVYLSRLAAQQIGGQITYRSSPGSGTTASVRLPRTKSSPIRRAA